MELSFLVMNVLSFGLFALCSWHALKVVRSRQRFFELVMAAFFGVLLEELNVIISNGYYAYSGEFLILFDKAPLAVGLGWAVIIYSAMSISDAYGLDERAKPFFDAIQAILIDLSMDAVAIRLGFWRWPIPLTAGWFGVPAGNFFGWMFVVATYSGYTRLIRYLIIDTRNKRMLLLQLASPPICYGILYSFLFVYVWIAALPAFTTETQRLWIFGFQLALFSAIVLASIIKKRPAVSRVEPAMSSVQITFHVVFFFALIVTGMFMSIPAMIPIATVLLAIDILLHRLPGYKLSHKR